jgi:sugar lactone lactonase YvrE
VPATPAIASLRPLMAVPGGRVTVEGGPFGVQETHLPAVRIGPCDARVVFATPREVSALVPPQLEGGLVAVRVGDAPGASVLFEVGAVIATGIHQVDSPAVDADGTVYLTCSGGRGQQTPVSIYRVRPGGPREVFVAGVTNATSLAVGPDGSLYVTSRFDGSVSRLDGEGRVEAVASDLGIACGLAFDADGGMFVGDRSGTVFRIEPSGETRTFATLPPSVAAYHLATGPDGALYVAGPTMAPRDHVYRLDPSGRREVFATGFGRPQGLAFGPSGALYVVEALAGVAGLYRVDGRSTPELVLSAPSLVGVAFDPTGGLVVASNETAWRFAGTSAL